MLGSDPCISASCALSARLMQAAFPPEAYAPLRADKTQTLDRSTGVTRCPPHHSSPAATPLGLAPGLRGTGFDPDSESQSRRRPRSSQTL